MNFFDPDDFAPLLERYQGRKHPLDYKNIYQLMVMVLLSAQDSDRHINSLAPALFDAFPTLADLAKADESLLDALVGKVVNSRTKISWLLALAQTVQNDDKIPKTLQGLTALKGIGRKSANVILREAGLPAEGIMVDLHVLRVAPRIGVTTGKTPEKIEKQLQEVFPKTQWGEIGMALSFLGRELCRPTNPKCPECPVKSICEFAGS